MIHTLNVSADSDPAELKKLMRKKLMTGGAVIRLDDNLPAGELEKIFVRFSPAAERYSLAAEVLVQLARHKSLTDELRSKLQTVQIPEVERELGATD